MSMTGMPGYSELPAMPEGARPEPDSWGEVPCTSPLEGMRRLLELLADPRGPRGALE